MNELTVRDVMKMVKQAEECCRGRTSAEAVKLLETVYSARVSLEMDVTPDELVKMAVEVSEK